VRSESQKIESRQREPRPGGTAEQEVDAEAKKQIQEKLRALGYFD
jgi:hypothetical protein